MRNFEVYIYKYKNAHTFIINIFEIMQRKIKLFFKYIRFKVKILNV